MGTRLLQLHIQEPVFDLIFPIFTLQHETCLYFQARCKVNSFFFAVVIFVCFLYSENWDACHSAWVVIQAAKCGTGVLFTLPSVDCGPPVAPKNGSLESYTDTTEGSEVFYGCDPGHVPQERMRAVCTRNGWSPNPTDLRCTGMLLWLELVPCIRESVDSLCSDGRDFQFSC